MLSTRFVRCFAASLMLTATTSLLHAETSARVSLRDSASPQVARTKSTTVDLGEVDGAQMLPSLMLEFAMSAQKHAALESLLVAQQNPASSQYHQWLTPEQFRAQFGVDRDSENAVLSWLGAQGFAVSEVSRGGLFVRFSGTAAQAKQAFGASIHRMSVNGDAHTANLSTLSVPAAFAETIAGVHGLDDFRPRAHGHVREESGDTDSPLYTTTSGTHYLAPGDVYKIYGQSLLPSSIVGTGVTIAVIGQSDINTSDITAFQTAAGLSAKVPTVNTYGTDPGSVPADVNEAEMDIEWAGAIAPGASILYVNSNDAIDGSLTEAIDYNLAPIVETSYGNCEANVGLSGIAYLELLFEMANSEGITVVAASGDSGATDCDVNVGSAVNGFAVDYPASSPNVTSVGGTEFNDASGSYWSTTNTGTATASATGYIPEIVWNDDNSAGFAATGGGPSAYFSKPTWQIGTGVPNDFARDVPDVSLAASIAHDGYLICSGSTNCTNGFANAGGGYVVSGGTSAASATFAGILALVEQKVGARLGNTNLTVYALANSSYGPNVFHDIVSGTNASACAAGTVNCFSGGPIGYAAGVGYDRATGWGSINTYSLVNDWLLVTPLAATVGQYPSQTTLAGSLASAVAGTPITFTMTVSSATTLSTVTPTGSVQMIVDGSAIGSAVMLSGGTGTYQLDTSSLSAGTHSVQASYSGDSTYLGSRALFTITVTAAGGPDFALTPTTTNITVKSGAIATAVTFTVSSIGGFTGSVGFKAALVAPLSAVSSFNFNPVTLTSTTTSATTQFTLLAYTYNSKLDVPRRSFPWQRGGAGVVLALTILCLVPRRRKLTWLALLLLSGVIGLSGCGPTNSPTTTTTTPTTTPTPTGTYSVLIQATGTVNGVVTEHTATITYVVQ